MAVAMAAAPDTTAVAYAESPGEISAVGQGRLNIAVCVIGTLILLGAICYFLRDKRPDFAVPGKVA